MTNEALQKANQSIKTTDVKGKEYAEVNQRIKAFRLICPNGKIENEILSVENGVCIIKSTVSDENGNILGVGHAYEKEGSSYINKTSFIENCETSAVGRALGMCGIGVDTSIASADEVANAIVQQSENGNSQKNRNTKGKPQSDPPQDAQSAEAQKEAYYKDKNKQLLQAIKKKSGADNDTLNAEYTRRVVTLGDNSNSLFHINNMLAMWFQELQQ